MNNITSLCFNWLKWRIEFQNRNCSRAAAQRNPPDFVRVGVYLCPARAIPSCYSWKKGQDKVSVSHPSAQSHKYRMAKDGSLGSKSWFMNPTKIGFSIFLSMWCLNKLFIICTLPPITTTINFLVFYFRQRFGNLSVIIKLIAGADCNFLAVFFYFIQEQCHMSSQPEQPSHYHRHVSEINMKMKLQYGC